MNALKTQDQGKAISQALIFIPDISGFTRFVSATETDHSQHIIRELLEILIESNELGMQISEVEGDAILFYRFGQAPTAAELLAQVQKMFVSFHHHLKKYATHRICNCGACTSASGLTLKFIGHYGEVSRNKVKNFDKLFGKDVILAHRLLKNKIDSDEYGLFTQPLVNACSNWVEVPAVAWTDIKHQSETYDCGKVDFCYLSLAPLMKYVPEPVMEDYSIKGMKKHLFNSSAIIEAPPEMVFSIVSDLPWRSKWIDGSLEETINMNHTILQTGSTHKCLAKGPTIVTHGFDAKPEKITMTDTDVDRSFCVVYEFEKTKEGWTKATANAFMKKHWFKNTIFKMFFLKGMIKSYETSWPNLNAYCKALLKSGKKHPYEIVISQEPVPA